MYNSAGLRSVYRARPSATRRSPTAATARLQSLAVPPPTSRDAQIVSLGDEGPSNGFRPKGELMTKFELWRELAAQLRVDSIRATTEAGSGHPTSSMSAGDLMAVLLADHLRYGLAKPKRPGNDHLVFSKGHASPLLYALLKAAGAITDAEMLTLSAFGSSIDSPPTPV